MEPDCTAEDGGGRPFTGAIKAVFHAGREGGAYIISGLRSVQFQWQYKITKRCASY